MPPWCGWRTVAAPDVAHAASRRQAALRTVVSQAEALTAAEHKQEMDPWMAPGMPTHNAVSKPSSL